MKNLTVIILMFWFCASLAQDQTYLLFEFMRVDNEQEASYAETEDFWEKIHQQRVENGDMLGWDLWSLQPGGEDQNFQYLTVHVYDDPAKMMDGNWGALMDRAKQAYPEMTEDALMKKMNSASQTRDIAVRIYLQLTEQTEDDFEMPLGTVARINFIKTVAGQNAAYQKFERETWKPMAQKMISNGNLSSWGLARVIIPGGSDVYASHLTFDMFKDYAQVFKENTLFSELSEEQQKVFQEGMAMRDLKWSSMGTLIKKIRSAETMAGN
jgi:hypothetical protein